MKVVKVWRQYNPVFSSDYEEKEIGLYAHEDYEMIKILVREKNERIKTGRYEYHCKLVTIKSCPDSF